MDERIFSGFIKFLDKEHQQILDEITKRRQELERLETEFYNFKTSRRESISRELYALRSEPNLNIEKIEKLQEELENLPSHEQLESEMGKLKQEIERLENQFINKPFILPESILTPLISFKVDIDGKFLVMGNDGKYYVKEDPFGTALGNYRVETDPNTHLPTRIIWVKQDSDTYGMPLVFSRELKINNPTIEIIKPIRKEVVKEVPEYKEVKISKFIPSITCPRCSWDMTELAKRVFCPNCSLSLYDAIKMQVERELGKSSLKENKKKRWFL